MLNIMLLERYDWCMALALAVLLIAAGSAQMVVGVGGIYHDDGVYISTAKALAGTAFFDPDSAVSSGISPQLGLELAAAALHADPSDMRRAGRSEPAFEHVCRPGISRHDYKSEAALPVSHTCGETARLVIVCGSLSVDKGKHPACRRPGLRAR
jgi:hypothetical protein